MKREEFFKVGSILRRVGTNDYELLPDVGGSLLLPNPGNPIVCVDDIVIVLELVIDDERQTSIKVMCAGPKGHGVGYVWRTNDLNWMKIV